MHSRTQTTFTPPVMAASRWLDGISFPDDRPLVNVCQAAPLDPPPRALREAMSDAVLNNDLAHFYGPDLGSPALREALARRTKQLYGGDIGFDQVAITSGCNQAFAAAIQALTGENDEVLLPVPWYFNHKMWLDMSGVSAVPVPTGQALLPDPDQIGALISPRTRALVIVTPNNPGGVEYPPELIQALYELCKTRGIRLLIDETYRDFHSATGPAHDLFADPDWPDTLVHLYSFSKAYRLTGHRVGALIGARTLLPEVEKFIDSVTICPNQIAQIAALWGIEHLDQWLAAERDEILVRRQAIETGFGPLTDAGWRLRGLGGFFAYVDHPFGMTSDRLAPTLVKEANVLLLPGTMFRPDSDRDGQRELRIAFANLDTAGITKLFDRLAGLDPMRLV